MTSRWGDWTGFSDSTPPPPSMAITLRPSGEMETEAYVIGKRSAACAAGDIVRNAAEANAAPRTAFALTALRRPASRPLLRCRRWLVISPDPRPARRARAP